MARDPEFYLQQLEDFLEDDTIRLAPDANYIDQRTKINFICNICDASCKLAPKNVYRDNTRCPQCFGKKRTKEGIQSHLDSLNKNIKVLSEYVNSLEKISCVCLKCNHQWSSRYTTLKYNGCPACNKYSKWTTEEFVQTVQSMKPITVLSQYKHAKTPVDCQCNECGTQWSPMPGNLLRPDKVSCPNCAKSGYNPSKPGYLYYLRVYDESQTYWKVGITNRSLKERFNPSERDKIVILYNQRFENGAVALQAERNILNLFKSFKAGNASPLKTGNTELFTVDVLQMDHLGNKGSHGWL